MSLNDKKLILPLYILPSDDFLIITPFLLETFLSHFWNLSLDFLHLLCFRKRFPYFLPCLYRVCMRKAAFHFITEAIMPTKFCFLRIERFFQISNFRQTRNHIIYQLIFGFIVMIRLERRRDTDRGFNTAWHCNDTIK